MANEIYGKPSAKFSTREFVNVWIASESRKTGANREYAFSRALVARVLPFQNLMRAVC